MTWLSVADRVTVRDLLEQLGRLDPDLVVVTATENGEWRFVCRMAERERAPGRDVSYAVIPVTDPFMERASDDDEDEDP